MQLVKFSLLCLLSLSLAGVVVAQTAVDPNADAGSASLQNFSGGATLRGTYFDVRYQSSSGVGYENGFTQIGAFTPFWVNEDAFIAPNARFLITDKNRIGANLGGVARQYNGNWDRIFGINGYYDSDETNYGNRYQQGTIGVESLGRNWDFRANGYFTFGTTDRFLKEICVGGDPFFVGNQIAFLGQQLREQSMSGADAEVGVPVLPSTPWLRAYAGVYGYQAKQDNYIGFRGRLDANISDDTTVGVMVTTDELFGTNVNATVDFRFSGFKPTRYFPQWATRERMLTSVQRNWRVSTNAYVQNVNVFAINPNDGDEYFVTHVDKTAAPGGDGSVENPFNLLPNSAPGSDLILVSANGTSEGDPLTTLNGLPLVLENNQRLLGEGKAHTAQMFATYGGCVVGSLDPNDPAGTFLLPGFANTGNYPFLSNVGSIVSLANNNEVAAFNMLNAGGFAITNSPAGSNNFLLQCLEISGNIGGGISLTDATGVGIIRGINLNSGSTNHPNPFGTGDNLGGGIFVDTGAAGLNLAMNDVAMNANPGMQLFGVSLLADDGSLTTTLTNVHADGFGPGVGNTVAGIILAETGETLTATLTDVSANANEGVGVMVTGTGGEINLTATNLSAIDNRLDNLQIGTQAAPLVGTVFNGDISDSFFNGSLEGSGIVYSQQGVSGLPNTLTLTNIQANNNFVDGLGLFGTAGTTMDVAVTDSALTGNQQDGIHVEELGGATIDLLVDPTDISGNGRDGFFFSVDASTLNASFVGLPGDTTSLDDNDRNALHGEVSAGSLVNLSLIDTTADRSGEDGFFFNVDASTLNVVAQRASIQDSGRLGVVGSGILGNVSSAGTVTFGTTTNPISGWSDFRGTTISNNLDNGVFVTASGQSNVQAVFRNVAVDDNDNTTASDGIRFDLDDSPDSSLQLLGSTTVNRNGRHGFELNATNGTNFTSVFTGTRLNDNGQDGGGSGVQINVDNSTVVQTFNNVNLANTNSNPVPAGTQEIGYEFNVSNGGSLTADFPLGGSLSNNLTNAVSGLVTDPASIASISLVDVTADNSGGDGASLLVTNEAVLDFSATSGTSFSNGGGAGVVVFAAGINSVANLAFDQVVIDGNANDGLIGVALAEGTLNACIMQTSIQDNGLTGINLNIIGAGGNPSVGNVHIENSTVDGNQEEGLLANALIGGQLNYRSVDTTYDGNGLLGGTFDGVQMNADGAGTRILNLFSGNLSSASGNSDDGYEFNATNGATLTAELDGTTASGNGGFGLNFNAQDAGTNAALLMTGTNDFSGNTGGTININVGAIDQIVLSLTGSFDNNNGDGIFLDINGATNALVAIQGGGTVSGNQNNGGANPEDNGDGIDIRMTNVTNGSILISGMTDISNNDADGIHIEMDTVTSGALEINGIAAINNNGDDAIDISLVDTTLDGAVALSTAAFEHLTLVDSVLADDPLTPLFDETCLPLVVTTDLGTLGLVADPFTINQVVADNNTNQGININASSSTIVADGGVITNNVIDGSLNGDGLHLDFNTVSADGLLIDGNAFSNNSDNGINFNLLNSPIDGLTITNNNGGNLATVGLSFLIVGNTFGQPFTITNTSDVGVDILSFNIDIQPTGNIWDTVDPGSPIAFAPVGGSDITTGLATVNGNPYPNAIPGGGVPDDQGLIDLTFTDFNSGETFIWDIDSDPIGIPGGAVSGNDLIGAPINVIFTGGLPQGGFLSAVPGDPTASRFVATSGNIGGNGISGNGLDGVRFNLNSSSLTNLVMDNNTIDSNGTDPAGGHGVNFNSVTNSDITTATFSNNSMSSNNGDGFRLVNPITAGAPIDLTFEDNTISSNTASGVEVQVNNAEQVALSFNSVTDGNDISSNGDIGISLTTRNTASFNLTMGGTGLQNTVEANGAAGIGILMLNTGAQGGVTSTFDIANTSASDNLVGTNLNFTGQGLGVILRGTSVLDGGSIITSNFDGNAAEGARFVVGGDNLGNFAELNNLTVGGASLALGNTFSDNLNDDGLEFFRTADGEIANAQVLNNTIEGNGQNGIFIEAANSNKIDTYTIDGNAINDNTQNGILFDIRASADIVADLDMNTITGNGNDGIRVIEQINNQSDSRTLGGTWTRNLITDNAQNGIRLNGFTTGLMIGDATDINLGNVISQNTQNGVLVTSPGDVTIGSNFIQENGTLANLGTANENAGVMLNVQPLSSVVTVTNNVITDNLGDGIQYSISNGFGGFSAQVAITDNDVSYNRGRGLDLINRFFSYTQADITGNTFNNNLLEGVYIVNTSSNNQDQFSSSTTALLNDGSVNVSRPILEVRFNDNEVNSNGINSNLAGTGLIVRVGTSNGGFGSNFAGDFASSGSALAVGADPFGLNSGRGGVTMTVDNSDFSGNFGDEIVFHSFVSTGDPSTGTTWDQTTFDTTNYQSDPLSRLDLYFRNNTYDTNSFSPVGTGLNGFSSRNPALVAFYNNSDGVFKSRLNTIVGPNIPGPFNFAGRARNATRLAARIPNFSAPGSPVGASFLYPGMGESTWRISSDTTDPNFILDASPYNDTNDSNGNFLNGIGANGELPFGWGQF